MSPDSLYLVECDPGAAAMPRALLTAHGYDVHVVAAEDFADQAGRCSGPVLVATSGPEMLCASEVLQTLGGRAARVPAIVVRPGCDAGDAARLLNTGAYDIVDEREPGEALLRALLPLVKGSGLTV